MCIRDRAQADDLAEQCERRRGTQAPVSYTHLDVYKRQPQTVHLLADTAAIGPRPHAEIRAEMGASARRHDDPVKAIAAIRAVRRAELLRLAMGDLLGSLDVDALGAGLSDVCLLYTSRCV